MKDARYAEIKELVERFDSLGDASFMSVLAENGVEADDLLAYSKHKEKVERAVKQARRK